MIAGNQLRKSFREWQSPPDPSTNHNIAGDRQHEGTAEWFAESDKFERWKVDGSLLWIHGKRTFHLPVATVISWTICSQLAQGKAFYGSSLLKYCGIGN